MPRYRALLIEWMRKFGRLLADRSGITLIESLIACLVVGIAAVGLATMFATGQASISGEGDNRVAVYLAQQKVEMARTICQGRVTRDSGGAVKDTNCNCFLTAATGTTCVPWPTGPDLFSKDMVAVVSPNQFYTRTTVVDCVSVADYASVVDCTTAGAATRVSVTVHARTKESRQDTDPAPVRLRAVLASR